MDNHTYNELLKWSILNTDPSSKGAPVTPQPRSEEDFAALRYAFSHIKSESALMLDYFTVIENAQAPAEEKYKAFEALRVCLGQVDNANNMDNIVPPDEKTDEEKKMEKNQEENVKSNVEQDVKSNEKKKGLWVRLIKQLDNQDPEIRMLAASCCQTAVENNRRSQERLLQLNAIPTLVRLATSDPYKGARKKATTALSSTVRNFQPGLDAVLGHMPAEYKPDHALDAADMESVDILINKLRESI